MLVTDVLHNPSGHHFFYIHSSHNTIPAGRLCDLIHMILTMNNFPFNDNHYLEIHGTLMAPSYAYFFLGYCEASTLENAPLQPHTWLQYIDGISMIWTEGLDNLKVFIDYLNNIYSTFKFTSSLMSTNDGSISTDLYTKLTDKHQHLPYLSCHGLVSVTSKFPFRQIQFVSPTVLVQFTLKEFFSLVLLCTIVFQSPSLAWFFFVFPTLPPSLLPLREFGGRWLRRIS